MAEIRDPIIRRKNERGAGTGTGDSKPAEGGVCCRTMRKKLKEKIMEALTSVLPITAIVLALGFTLAPMPTGTLMLFLMGAVLLIVGMGLFSLGAEMSMMPMGEGVGREVVQPKRLLKMIPVCFLIGAVITIAEPDLQVLARQVPAVPDLVLILTVAAGVGFFLVVALLRTKCNISLQWMLIGGYALVFLLAIFVPKDFLAVAFDSGGVTTGPITVPFIMALGLGMASIRTDKHNETDSFGIVALCSIGPILATMILGMCYRPSSVDYVPFTVPNVLTTRDVGAQFATGFPTYIKEVVTGLLPILILFLAFQLIFLKLARRSLARIGVGVVYTFVGLVLFLTGVNVGFMPAGNFIGKEIAKLPYNWILIPLGMLVGYFIVAAEPAVYVLNRQVEELTGGAIPRKAMGLALSIGVSISLGLAMTRVLTGISILWFVVPGYALAIGLTFVTPKVFTAIAFDSGGVASGPMAATFLIPFAMGACEQLGGNILTDAFGIVAMVAMTPLIMIQLLGLMYERKSRKDSSASGELVLTDEIIDYGDYEGVSE